MMLSAEQMRKIVNEFKSVAPDSAFWSLRIVNEQYESLNLRQHVMQPPFSSQSRGAHISIIDGAGYAYAATCHLNRDGFRHAIEHARRWNDCVGRHALLDSRLMPRPSRSGEYHTPVRLSWDSTSLSDKLALMNEVSKALKIDERIVDWQVQLARRQSQSVFVTSDGVEIEQCFHYVMPGYLALANRGSESQQRSGGGWGSARQGGLELLMGFNFSEGARQTAEEAIYLLEAPDCPSETTTLLLMPNQMMLQIHESIGHPLELDRILGDERNYAGTSFITPDMVGSYQYGSPLLNVTYDPDIARELGSFAFDDDGEPARCTYIIRDGILQCLLGSAVSQARANQCGVANARAGGWNRPPIDRMANLNLEPGDKSMLALIEGIENGILMDTNVSWSIDDSRNKFQFGCEMGRVVKNGELRHIVKNPNYRGVSATFWRNLAAVGDHSTFEVWGTSNCGKGEPNQLIKVGHASPACVFRDVDVFGSNSGGDGSGD